MTTNSSATIKKRSFIKRLLMGAGALMVPGLNRLRAIPLQIGDGPDWKWSKLSKYMAQTPRGVKCTLCPNNCILEEGETGDCRVRVNVDGKIYSLAYGDPCAVNIDPIEKKPLYHFKPTSKAFSIGTAGCNFACLNCQNWQISQRSPKETNNKEYFPKQVVDYAVQHQCKSVAYTYTEPTVFYEYMYDTAKIARDKGLKNLMITNGYIHKKPLEELSKYLDAANVDLKSVSNKTYITLNAGTLQPVLDTLRVLRDQGVWLEITNLVIPGYTDNLDMIKAMCEWFVKNDFRKYPLHFSRFYPAYKLRRVSETPLSILVKAREIAKDAGMQYVYLGNVTENDASNTYCHHCGELIIRRSGYRITKYNIKDGNCGECGKAVPGVW
jgi:pyruvate formate lyase activating enzyme